MGKRGPKPSGVRKVGIFFRVPEGQKTEANAYVKRYGTPDPEVASLRKSNKTLLEEIDRLAGAKNPDIINRNFDSEVSALRKENKRLQDLMDADGREIEALQAQLDECRELLRTSKQF